MNYNKINKNDGIFVQIGAGAGDLDSRANYRDGFTEFIKKLDPSTIKRIILVEPNPLNIELLKKCWKNYPQAEIYELGIVPSTYKDNNIKLYYCPSDAPHYQVASVNIDHVKKHYGTNCIIKNYNIKVTSLENFINQIINTDVIDLLALDIEGIDKDVILDINFNNLKIKYLSFEYIHLGNYKDTILNYLKDNNFEFVGSGMDHNNFDYLYINKYIK